MTSYMALKEQAQKLLQEAELVRKQELKTVIDQIKHTMAQYGLTGADLGFRDTVGRRSKNKGKSQTQEAKYKGPNGEIWSGGRGRKPDWVKNILAQGRNLNEFLISGQ
jgi:DNA-binding protein H-NS